MPPLQRRGLHRALARGGIQGRWTKPQPATHSLRSFPDRHPLEDSIRLARPPTTPLYPLPARCSGRPLGSSPRLFLRADFASTGLTILRPAPQAAPHVRAHPEPDPAVEPAITCPAFHSLPLCIQ